MQFLFIILIRAVELYSLILFVYALMSWVPDLYQSTVGRWIVWLVKPVLKPFEKLNLQFMGLDWTVFVALITLNIVARFLGLFFYFF